MSYKWVTVKGDGGSAAFKVSQSSGTVYVYDGNGRAIGETRSMEDAIILIKSTYGKRVWTTDIGPEFDNTCFSSMTRILTPRGWRFIAEIERGDSVLSLNETSNGLEICTVSSRQDHPAAHTLQVCTETPAVLVRTTAVHRLLTPDGWVAAGKLEAGDVVLSVTGSTVTKTRVAAVCDGQMVEPVHNLITTGPHNFIAEGIVAHNFAFARIPRTAWHRLFVDPWVAPREKHWARA